MVDLKEEEKGVGILDVKAALEDAFKGCDVRTPNAMMGSFHAEVKFDEYEIQVILSGKRGTERSIYFRFQQRVKSSGRKRSTKVLINEVKTTNPKDLAIAIRDAKEHLLGIVQAIQRALKPRPVSKVRDIDDLLRGD